MGGDLETSLRQKRDAGRKIFAPYVTAGLEGVDADLLRRLEDAGADAIELGVPFSDPIMDGVVVQQASERALRGGFHVRDAFTLVKDADLDIPILLMTYVNPVLAMGDDAWIQASLDAGVGGFIVPDLPVDEGAPFAERCAAAGLANVFLAAPGTAPERLARIGAMSAGFVYCVATYGVTGAREELGGDAETLIDGLRPLTDLPLLVGVGITTPEQAAAVSRFADGVVVGSAIVRPFVDGDVDGAVSLASAFRAALD